MALVNLPNLYCTYNDVADYLSTEGIELRLDDHTQATGQQVLVTIPASAGATSLSVEALGQYLPNGCVLNFDGGGLSPVLQVILTALAPVGATTLAVMALGADVPQGASAIDNGVNIASNARVAKARAYATATCKRYCTNRYDDSQLAQAWSVNQWATVIAARWVAKRRAQGCPQAIEDDYKEALDELKKVQVREMDVEDIYTRNASWPSWFNATIDQTYDVNRVRVEQSTSDPTITQFPVLIDWYDNFAGWDY
jgi:hypothetical protein